MPEEPVAMGEKVRVELRGPDGWLRAVRRVGNQGPPEFGLPRMEYCPCCGDALVPVLIYMCSGCKQRYMARDGEQQALIIMGAEEEAE